MVNPWRKYKNAPIKKKQALRSLIAGLALFCVLRMITSFISVPLCPIKNLFGVSCPGCGLTRGFISVLKFDFSAATDYNVLSVPLFIGISLYALLCVSDILFSRNDVERVEGLCRKKCALIIFLLIFLASICLNQRF